ncbi:C6 transcription factor [Cladophialophora carrionii]|uniref:C6 transcription factor n=1 Tax=Cladophialophora carrionii TaxID=86049 RepID=A0A1C1CKZ9_9EURO|nr:C6 transcription factor [Cladophialophora carrionii]
MTAGAGVRDLPSTSRLLQDQHEGVVGDERPTKRQKVAAACDQCREKKIKCDGLKPRCSPCQRRAGANAHCEWGVRKKRSTGASKLEIVRLQSRIDELERVHRRKSPPPESTDQTSPSTPRSASDANHHPSANAILGLIEEGGHGEESVVGDSSAASFMNRIKAVLDQQLSPSSAQQPRSTSSSAVPTGLHRQRRFRNPDYVLPSRQQADKLLEVYWRLVDPLYPFIDKDDFMGKYQSLWAGTPTMDDEVCFICLLNATFAVACILDSSIRPQDRVSSGEVYFKRAQGYVDLEFLQFQSVHTVQCLLLLAQYLQSTREPQQCWLFVGLAIRIAQSLGLDLPSTSARAHNGRPDDFLRKVWHGCVLMDRILSMTFGRPTIITPQAAASVPRPLAHPGLRDCECHRDLAPLDASPSDLHFFLETLQLYEIMSETLLALYSPATGGHSSTADDSYTPYFGALGSRAAGTVLEMDAKYSTWQRALPFHLQFAPGSGMPQNLTHARQARVLYLRYSHIRTLLFRPVLSRFCSICHHDDNIDRDSLAYKLALQCSVMCVQSALDTVNLFGKVHSEVRVELLDDILPAWWYCILYLYTAATVLVAARLNSMIGREIGGADVILNASRTVTAALHRYGSFGKHTKRCAAAIELLFDQIPGQATQQGSQKSSELNNTSAPSLAKGISTDLEPDRTARGGQSWTFADNGAGAGAGAGTNSANVDFGQSTVLPNDASVDFATDTGETTATAPPLMMDEAFFEPSDLRLDFDLGGDMSWLSSIPFELYSEGG